MYVRAGARRSGLGRELLRRAIEHAALSVEKFNLSVGSDNDGARELYKFAGFQKYGLEMRAIKIGNAYYDDILMSLSLSEI